MDISQLNFGFAAELTPALSFAAVNRHLGWALTLTALTLFLLRPLPSILRFVLAAAAFVTCIVPATWGLTPILALAYLTPSLVTQGIAILYLLQLWQNRHAPNFPNTNGGARWPTGILLLAITVGWALFLDTFAVLPVQLYAMGYGMGVSLLGLTAAIILWVASRGESSQRRDSRTGSLAVVLLCAIAIFTFTRLPSGNAWDAMLDPWLWIAAHVILIGRSIFRTVRRSRPIQI